MVFGSVLGDADARHVAEVLAAKHGVSPAQIILRWNVQRGVAVIPKSSKPERLAQNLALFGLELTPAEMDAISGLDQHRRFNDPGVFCEGMGAQTIFFHKTQTKMI